MAEEILSNGPMMFKTVEYTGDIVAGEGLEFNENVLNVVGKQDTLTFEYDSDNAITSIDGHAIKQPKAADWILMEDWVGTYECNYYNYYDKYLPVRLPVTDADRSRAFATVSMKTTSWSTSTWTDCAITIPEAGEYKICYSSGLVNSNANENKTYYVLAIKGDGTKSWADYYDALDTSTTNYYLNNVLNNPNYIPGSSTAITFYGTANLPVWVTQTFEFKTDSACKVMIAMLRNHNGSSNTNDHWIKSPAYKLWKRG